MSTANPPYLLQEQLCNISLFFSELYMSKKICIVIDILFCLTVSLQKTKPEIHADRAETSKMQFLPGKAALLIIPVREASSWRDPTLTSWHLRIAWIVSEWEIRNCKTCTTRKKEQIWMTQNLMVSREEAMLLNNFKRSPVPVRMGFKKKKTKQKKPNKLTIRAKAPIISLNEQ